MSRDLGEEQQQLVTQSSPTYFSSIIRVIDPDGFVSVTAPTNTWSHTSGRRGEASVMKGKLIYIDGVHFLASDGADGSVRELGFVCG